MRRAIGLVTAALLSLAACKDATSPDTNDGGAGSTIGQVSVGNVFFRSAHNGSQNPAVDTIPAGGKVVWSWVDEGSHSIQSTGTPGIFRSSIVLVGSNYTYSVTFNNPGTYEYQCGVDSTAMTGRIVVLP